MSSGLAGPLWISSKMGGKKKYETRLTSRDTHEHWERCHLNFMVRFSGCNSKIEEKKTRNCRKNRNREQVFFLLSPILIRCIFFKCQLNCMQLMLTSEAAAGNRHGHMGTWNLQYYWQLAQLKNKYIIAPCCEVAGEFCTRRHETENCWLWKKKTKHQRMDFYERLLNDSRILEK